ncbi:MAG: fklB [Verrucomicrobiaceae bacterium]|nr:fklB [Verrucomicrobiaceae bacterium]
MATVPRDKVSYNMGRTTAKNMVDVGFKPDINAYMEGVKSALEGAAPKFTEEEMAEAVKKFKAALPSDAQLKRTKAIKSGKEYLATNGKRKEVTTTASGLQYEVLKAADGPKPQATDIVKVHYHGTLVDGTVFDSSVDRKAPISFRLDGVIPGWTEGVLLMNKGSKYKFVIPNKLAYGDQGQGAVGPNETLIFEVELLDINPPEAAK